MVQKPQVSDFCGFLTIDVNWQCLYLSTHRQLSCDPIKPVRCSQSETRMLVSDWLQLTALAWDATELTVSRITIAINGYVAEPYSYKW